MSTPTRHAKYIDPPPYVRTAAGPGARPCADRAIRPGSELGSRQRSSLVSKGRKIGRFTKVQRRLALDPEWVPQPPQSQPDGRFYWKIALSAVGILGLAAVMAWVVVSIPSARLLLKSDVVRAGFLGTSVATDLAEQFPRTQLSDRQTGVSARTPPSAPNKYNTPTS